MREICHKMRQIERKILAKEREARSCERDGGKILGFLVPCPVSSASPEEIDTHEGFENCMVFVPNPWI